ncbi:molecular chaperone DnaJ [Mycoplasma sp. AC157]|uniref:molecular chaperone DnaJ n=1 Tax=Mycoplasma sp. 480 TaxID=3440155 RepID=UPI003F51122C
MKKRDYYEVLEINKNATDKEIKIAYRKLAMKYHPDKNKETDAEEKFKEVNEAYEVLSNPEKRAQYDQYGHDAFDPNAQAGFGGFGNFGGFSGFSDFFGDIFGGFGRRKSRENYPEDGSDYKIEYSISFLESILGTSIKRKFDKYSTCNNCHGSGANSTADIKKCSTCGGTGSVTKVIKTPFGAIQNSATCSDCSGKGKRIQKLCKLCSGKGIVKESKELTVSIPAGIKEGQSVVLNGYGGPGLNGGQNGDLYIEITVRDHIHYTRVGDDIHLTVPVSVIDIISENLITIPTPYGNEEIRMNNSYKSGDVLTVKNKGSKNPKNNSYGNLKIHLQLYVPKLSNSEKKAMESIFSGVKDDRKNKWLKDFD